MITITNPPFKLCKNKKFIMAMKSKNDAVILATFRFCNNLGNYDLIDVLEWPEITRTTPLAIYDSHEKNNSIEMPDFYEKWLDRYDETYKDDYIASCNGRLNDPIRSEYLDPMWRDLTPDLFIAKAGNQHIKVGDNIRRKIYPKRAKEIYERYKDQIILDTYLWRSSVSGQVLIRKEFFD